MLEPKTVYLRRKEQAGSMTAMFGNTLHLPSATGSILACLCSWYTLPSGATFLEESSQIHEHRFSLLCLTCLRASDDLCVLDRIMVPNPWTLYMTLSCKREVAERICCLWA